MKFSAKSETIDTTPNPPKLKSSQTKENIEFEKSDLAELVALGQASSSKTLNQTFQTKKNKKSKKRIKLQLNHRVTYSPRDVKIGLLQFSPEPQSIHASDEVLKVYIKKSLMWSTTIVSSLGILEGLNILSQKFLAIGFSTYLVLGACAVLNLIGFTALHIREKNLTKKSNKYNPKANGNSETLLLEMIDLIAKKFHTPTPKLQITLQPLICIERKKSELQIKIGLPLLHRLSNTELLALISYHFYYYTLCQDNRITHLFNYTTQQPLKNKFNQSNSISTKILSYPCGQLHFAVIQAATIGAIEVTSFKTVVSAYEKNFQLLLAYKNCIALSKKGELIPINAVTQIVCAAEGQDIAHLIACAHVHDQVKSLIKDREDTIELAHQEAEVGPVFSSQWLLRDGNQLANKLSMSMLKRFKFSPDQLEKTHTAHQAFPSLLETDPIQQYYSGFFRMNRNITPNLTDGDAGSLLTLKAELASINQDIKAAAPQFSEHLQEWDSHLTPHHTRQSIASPQSQRIEKLHLDLQQFEALLGKKSGLCLAITLSIANPLEQKVLYQALAAHRKCLNLQRVIDSVVYSISALQDNESSAHILALRRGVLSLINLCDVLPTLRVMGVASCTSTLHSLLETIPRTSNALTAQILPNTATQLIQQLEEYRWLTERQLVEACTKVEERLNIEPLHISVSPKNLGSVNTP